MWKKGRPNRKSEEWNRQEEKYKVSDAKEEEVVDDLELLDEKGKENRKDEDHFIYSKAEQSPKEDCHRRRHCTSFRHLLRRQFWVNTVRMAATLRKLFKSHRSSSGGRSKRKQDSSAELGEELPKVSSPRLFHPVIEVTGGRVGPSERVIGGANGASSPKIHRTKSCSPSASPIKSSLNIKIFKKNNGPRPSLPPSETYLKHMKTVRSRRLLREFHELSKSQMTAKDPIFTVDLVSDCLYEWKIKLLRIDPESELFRDMVEFNIAYILLSLSFPESFPFQPPFLRVLAPKLEKGFVMEGGAICMELLTPRGWASAYTIEAVVMQFAASLVKGQARISRKLKNPKEFNKRSAEASFRSLVKTHDKYGWVTPPLAEG